MSTSSSEKKSFNATVIFYCFFLVLTAIIVAYLGVALFFVRRYVPGTTINGIDVGNMGEEKAAHILAKNIPPVTFTLKSPENSEVYLTEDELGLSYDTSLCVRRTLTLGNAALWPVYFFHPLELETDLGASFDTEVLFDTLGNLEMLKNVKYIPPTEPSFQYVEGQGYEYIPGENGQQLSVGTIALEIERRIRKREYAYTIGDAGEIITIEAEQNQELMDKVALLNRLAGARITYDLGEASFTLEGDELLGLVHIDNEELTVDEELVRQKVGEYAETFDTYGLTKPVKTSCGHVSNIAYKTIGWQLDQEAETEQLIQDIYAGKPVQRDMNWKKEGISHGEHPFGGTYVEVDLNCQHLYFYENGELAMESDIVSGNDSWGMNTPSGVYHIYFMQRNRTLIGPNYRTPVAYWMAFNGAIGLHDATWQPSFGGDRYLLHGSHGCINLPLDFAGDLYERVYVGMPVVCTGEEE